MDRGLKLSGMALLLGIGAALAGCSSDGVGNQFAGCTGGYPDGGGIGNMSPYSPDADPYQPDCESRG